MLILLSVVITTLLVAATIGTGRDDLAGNLTAMVLLQAAHLRAESGAWIEIAFLMGGALVLSTQVGIVDTVTRIAGDIFYDRIGRRTRTFTLKRTFLGFLTLFVAASVGVILLVVRRREPEGAGARFPRPHRRPIHDLVHVRLRDRRAAQHRVPPRRPAMPR